MQKTQLEKKKLSNHTLLCLLESILMMEMFFLQLKNLSAMEVNLIRPFIVRALQSFYKHDSEDMMAPNQTVEESQLAASDRPRVCFNAPPHINQECLYLILDVMHINHQLSRLKDSFLSCRIFFITYGKALNGSPFAC